MVVMKALCENGVWAIPPTPDVRVLQFKPGLLMTPDLWGIWPIGWNWQSDRHAPGYWAKP